MEQTLVNGIADNLLHNIFNDLSVGLELYDKDGLMIDVNYSRLRSMGIKDKKDILGYNLFNYTSFSDEIKEQVRKGETVRFMAKYDFDDLCRLFPTNLSGIKFFEITVSFVHNDKSEITNYMVITQDITERVLWQNKYDNLYEEVVRSKKELLESEQRMIHLIRQNELVLNNINSGLAYIANDYIVQWENISLCSKSLSYEAYKKGEPCYLTAHNRTTPCENCVMQRARKSGQVESILFNLDNKHVIEVFATPIFNEQGDVDGVVIRVDDVTERQHMIGELEKARSRAEQSDKLKSAFLANMSHEIRTPLNAIVGFSDLLMVTEDQEEKEEFIQIINANNELLLKLINDILDLSKIEAGSVELKYEDFDLAVYFNELAASMHHRVVNPQVRLVPVNPYETCTVRLDKNRLAQILTNFVTNAIKYTSKGTIEMGYEKIDENIRLYVRDTGIGIPEDKKDKVFHRFEKLDEFAQGTGLGLSICKAIVEACRGEIGFESEFDKGSLFWAVLPCQFKSVGSESTSSRRNNEKDADKENVLDSEETKKVPKRVLVVEDIQSNFFLVSSILKNKCQLLHAPNGLEAVEIVRTQPVDLVLMDMKMPVMDGLQATSAIRNLNKPGAHSIPIIAMTANAFKDDIQRCLDAGMNMHMSKPVNMEKLLKALAKFKGEVSTTGNGETSGEVVTTTVKTTDNIETTGETVTPVVTTTNGDSINRETTSNNATNGVVPKPSTTSTSLQASNSKKPATTKVKKVKATKKSLTIKWSKVKGASGYEIQVATDKKFKKNKKSILVKKQKTTSAKIKKLKSKKKYYVRVRTYKVVGRKKVYSSWINGKATKTK